MEGYTTCNPLALYTRKTFSSIDPETIYLRGSVGAGGGGGGWNVGTPAEAAT